MGIYRDGRLVARPVANRRTTASRCSLGQRPEHGFDVTVMVAPGEHRFWCSPTIGPGKNTKLGEKRIRMHAGEPRHWLIRVANAVGSARRLLSDPPPSPSSPP